MQDFSIKVGKKKFRVTQSDCNVTVMCGEKQVRLRECESVEQAESVYDVILDTLNDVGEHFD